MPAPKPPTPPDSEVKALAQRYADRGVHDNQRCISLWLKLFGDGSGSVMAEYHDVKPGYEEESKAAVRMVMTMNPTSIIDFDSIEELHGALVAATCKPNTSEGREHDRD